jgi:hypothetical protein
MTDDGLRVWAATQAEIEALRASVARLTAERDAALTACESHLAAHRRLLEGVGRPDLDCPCPTCRAARGAVSSVRRAAELEPEKEAPRG